MSRREVIGIDLGTTHTAVFSDTAGELAHFQIPQLVSPGNVSPAALLPSFVYFAHASEGALALPWAAERRFAVGTLARKRAAEVPGRIISSAKSWLSHDGVDRRQPLLPENAPEDVEKISPVEATFRILDHVAEAWQAACGTALGEQEVILTVPASFDAAARDLTVEAAYAAGLENLTLLEEPQAALYAWIAVSGDDWRKHLQPGDMVLVVDIGGGTTDFSAIAAVEVDGSLELHRVAVGDHILLGGDNMDLTLAYTVARKLKDRGTELDRIQMAALGHACRAAKEELLADDAVAAIPIAVAGRGSQLMGSSVRSELTRDEVEQVLVEGFFPITAAHDTPKERRGALRELGLPYAADPAITRHLAQFLTRQAQAAERLPEASAGRLLRPTAVLFNGGVVKAETLRSRLLDALNAWLREDGADPVRVLPGGDPDLAVARGAAYYGRVRSGQGLRIRGGTARAYYVGIESPAPAVPGLDPPIEAMCVAPFGMEEGSEATLPKHELGLVVGQPVAFRFFGSTVRRTDKAGMRLQQWRSQELEELSPIEIELPAEGRHEGDIVPIRLAAQITPVGTLLLEAIPLAPLQEGERWKIELGVRVND